MGAREGIHTQGWAAGRVHPSQQSSEAGGSMSHSNTRRNPQFTQAIPSAPHLFGAELVWHEKVLWPYVWVAPCQLVHQPWLRLAHAKPDSLARGHVTGVGLKVACATQRLVVDQPGKDGAVGSWSEVGCSI